MIEGRFRTSWAGAIASGAFVAAVPLPAAGLPSSAPVIGIRRTEAISASARYGGWLARYVDAKTPSDDGSRRGQSICSVSAEGVDLSIDAHGGLGVSLIDRRSDRDDRLSDALDNQAVWIELDRIRYPLRVEADRGNGVPDGLLLGAEHLWINTKGATWLPIEAMFYQFVAARRIRVRYEHVDNADRPIVVDDSADGLTQAIHWCSKRLVGLAERGAERRGRESP